MNLIISFFFWLLSLLAANVTTPFSKIVEIKKTKNNRSVLCNHSLMSTQWRHIRGKRTVTTAGQVADGRAAAVP